MEIRLTEQMIAAVGKKALTEWIATVEERYSYGRDHDLDLRRFSNASVERLFALLKPHDGKVPGVRVILRDVKVWIAAGVQGVEKTKCKSTQSFSGLVFEYLKKQKSHWLFQKDDSREVWRAYYVGFIKFHPKVVERSSYGTGVTPARTKFTLYFVELGSTMTTSECWEDGDVKDKTVVEALAAKGYIVASDELMAEYGVNTKRFVEIHDKIGKQFLARGYGTSDLDGSYRSDGTNLDKDGDPARVVIDVISESDRKSSEKESSLDPDFWNRVSLLSSKGDVNLPKVAEEDADDDDTGKATVETPAVELPLYPTIPTFDLKRHARFRLHVAQLEEYVYDVNLGAKLILPQEVTDLVGLLISEKSGFRDIVQSKGGGAVILCAGPAGCGKTLTAEVYAEVMKRPLYSVQCSQLGTNETNLEKELLRVFDRSQRWNAILLLDEADVYVRARGTDLQQNAIVGVFLRVLEYYNGVLFMTTNRSDFVDDAITSRCLARIDYAIPTPENQARIWHVLAEGSGLDVPGHVITEIVTKYPRLSGRDVKQLLKLAGKVLFSKGAKTLDLHTVEFVKRFKPTPGGEEAALAGTGKRLVPSKEPAGAAAST